MNYHDFNMYYGKTFVKLNTGYLGHVRCDDDCIKLDIYTQASSKPTKQLVFPFDDENIDSVVAQVLEHINQDRVELKPFVLNGTLYSPSIKSLRYYKSGLDANNVDLRVINTQASPTPNIHEWAVAMFFSPFVSVEEGVDLVCSHQQSYALLEDGFVLTKYTPREDQDISYAAFIPTEDDMRVEFEHVLKTGKITTTATCLITGKTITTDTEHTSYFDTEGWDSVFERDGRGYLIVPSKLMLFFYECALARYEASLDDKTKLPVLELYRGGMLICNDLLNPTETTTKVLQGLPRLSAFIDKVSTLYQQKYNEQVTA